LGNADVFDQLPEAVGQAIGDGAEVFLGNILNSFFEGGVSVAFLECCFQFCDDGSHGERDEVNL